MAVIQYSVIAGFSTKCGINKSLHVQYLLAGIMPNIFKLFFWFLCALARLLQPLSSTKLVYVCVDQMALRQVLSAPVVAVASPLALRYVHLRFMVFSWFCSVICASLFRYKNLFMY